MYKLTEQEILSTLLTNNKDRFIKKINWNDYVDDNFSITEQEVLDFFHSHSNLENKIDWNKDLDEVGMDIIALIDETKQNAQNKLNEKNRKKTTVVTDIDWESHDCKKWYEDDDVILVSPLSWEGAKFMDSDACGGGGAKWCIGWEDEDYYWRDYVFHGNSMFVLIINKRATNVFTDMKFMCQIQLRRERIRVWRQDDDPHKSMYFNLSGDSLDRDSNNNEQSVVDFLQGGVINKICELIPQIQRSFDNLRNHGANDLLSWIEVNRVDLMEGLKESYSDILDLIEHYMMNEHILEKQCQLWIDSGLLGKIDDNNYVMLRKAKRSDVVYADIIEPLKPLYKQLVMGKLFNANKSWEDMIQRNVENVIAKKSSIMNCITPFVRGYGLRAYSNVVFGYDSKKSRVVCDNMVDVDLEIRLINSKFEIAREEGWTDYYDSNRLVDNIIDMLRDTDMAQFINKIEELYR